MALAEKLKAPVGYSFRGKEWVEYDNPNAVGMSGLLGWGAAYKAMHECDVLLLLGTDFPYESFMPKTPKMAKIDVRAERLGRRCKLDLGLCGDVGDTLRALLPLVQPQVDRSFLDGMLGLHVAAQRKLRAYVDHVEHATADPPRARRRHAGRTRRTGRRFHHRHRDVRRLGCPLPAHRQGPAFPRLVQPRIDG